MIWKKWFGRNFAKIHCHAMKCCHGRSPGKINLDCHSIFAIRLAILFWVSIWHFSKCCQNVLTVGRKLDYCHSIDAIRLMPLDCLLVVSTRLLPLDCWSITIRSLPLDCCHLTAVRLPIGFGSIVCSRLLETRLPPLDCWLVVANRLLPFECWPITTRWLKFDCCQSSSDRLLPLAGRFCLRFLDHMCNMLSKCFHGRTPGGLLPLDCWNPILPFDWCNSIVDCLLPLDCCQLIADRSPFEC